VVRASTSSSSRYASNPASDVITEPRNPSIQATVEVEPQRPAVRFTCNNFSRPPAPRPGFSPYRSVDRAAELADDLRQVHRLPRAYVRGGACRAGPQNFACRPRPAVLPVAAPLGVSLKQRGRVHGEFWVVLRSLNSYDGATRYIRRRLYCWFRLIHLRGS
jgi:hypothetical protein